MGVVLPPAAAGMMAMLGPWPNLDEDDIRAERDATRVAHAGTVPAASGADTSMRGVQQVYRGESGTSAQNHWAKAGADGGHLTQANNAMKLAPVALEAGAAVVSAVKVAVGTQAVFTAVAVHKALFYGGAAGLGYATARTLMARKTVGKILREGSEGGNVIARIIRRRILEPMRRILDNLRRPGGLRPAFAGAGGRTVGPRATTGPRHVSDYMAKMGRSNKNARGGGNGRRGGGGRRGGSPRNSTDGTTSHAADRQGQRGISDDQVRQTVENGQTRPGNTPGTTVHETNSVRVVTNNKGGIVSAIWKKKK
ncbi:DUF4258 domain-containing protein [Nonomuraea sp. NPDC052116]|uniref:DUF4258 domain-containing protein n=1 Tax=Nonomuraea sp. NPDC052116 TaxID=3155665 RepID=UPI003422B98C